MKKLGEKEVRALCRPADFDNGRAYFQQGKLTGLWQTEASLHALVAGSSKNPYRVSVTEQGTELTPKCTCPAHRRYPFCKHVAAVLVAWARTPEQFVAGEPPAPPKPKSRARRARKPKVDRCQVQAEGLTKIEELLVDLANFGLLSLTEAQVARVSDLAHTAESHKLRRLARLVASLGMTLNTALADQEQAAQKRFDETGYAELLSDTWLTAQATRRALEDPQADPTTLEDLVGKTWREKDLERREGVRLLELAYETVQLDSSFTVDTSFLLNLDDGILYTEKQIVPTRLKNQPRKPSYAGRLEGTIGLYPGPEPRRVKLIEIGSETPLTDTDWLQALAYAERSVAALFRRYQEVTVSPLALPEAYAFFAPTQMVVDGPTVHLLDAEGQALPLAEGWRILGLLTRQPIVALLARLALQEGSLNATPLGVVSAPPDVHLIRVGIR